MRPTRIVFWVLVLALFASLPERASSFLAGLVVGGVLATVTTLFFLSEGARKEEAAEEESGRCARCGR